MGRMLTAKALRPLNEVVPARAVALVASPIPAVGPDPVVEPASANVERANPVRKVAFYAGVGFLFVRLGVVPEIIFWITQSNTPILYLLGIPAILGAFFAGGLQRMLRYRPAVLWMMFYGWMALAIPFSSWTGGSWMRVSDYGRYELPLLFVVGGLAASWKDAKVLCYTIGAAAVC